MRPVYRYAGAGLALVVGLGALAWPWLDVEARNGMMLAGAVAWPVQVVAFGLLVRHREELNHFLLAWVGGTIVRMGLVFGVALVLLRLDRVAVAPTLLALAGFFFGLLLLEPVFFRAAARPESEARMTDLAEDSKGT